MVKLILILLFSFVLGGAGCPEVIPPPLENQNTEFEALKAQVGGKDEEIAQAKAKLAEIETLKQQLEQQNQQLKQQMPSLQTQVQTLMQQLTQLQQANQTASSSSTGAQPPPAPPPQQQAPPPPPPAPPPQPQPSWREKVKPWVVPGIVAVGLLMTQFLKTADPAQRSWFNFSISL